MVDKKETVKKAVGILINPIFKPSWEDIKKHEFFTDADEFVDVEVHFEGQMKQFTFKEFYELLGFDV